MLNQAPIEHIYPMIGEMKSWNHDPAERGRKLRALTTTYPGGADQLWLERWAPGEFDGWELEERVEVAGGWINRVELLHDDGAWLYLREVESEPDWSEADKRKHSKHFRVSIDFETLGTRAETIRGAYYAHGGASLGEVEGS